MNRDLADETNGSIKLTKELTKSSTLQQISIDESSVQSKQAATSGSSRVARYGSKNQFNALLT